MKTTGRKAKIVVSGDGAGIVSQAGALPLMEALRVTGLDQGLSRTLARWRASRAVHDPGKIVTDSQGEAPGRAASSIRVVARS